MLRADWLGAFGRLATPYITSSLSEILQDKLHYLTYNTIKVTEDVQQLENVVNFSIVSDENNLKLTYDAAIKSFLFRRVQLSNGEDVFAHYVGVCTELWYTTTETQGAFQQGRMKTTTWDDDWESFKQKFEATAKGETY